MNSLETNIFSLLDKSFHIHFFIFFYFRDFNHFFLIVKWKKKRNICENKFCEGKSHISHAKIDWFTEILFNNPVLHEYLCTSIVNSRCLWWVLTSLVLHFCIMSVLCFMHLKHNNTVSYCVRTLYIPV